MTLKLREAMTRVAEGAPALHVPADLLERGRKRRRLQLAGSALMAIVVLAGMASLGWFVVPVPPKPRPAAVPQDRLAPGTMARAPKWVADLRDAPLDRAQLAYVKPDVKGNDGRLIVVSGDRYRTADLGGTLSLDGRYLVYQQRQSTKIIDVSTGVVAMVGEARPWHGRVRATPSCCAGRSAPTRWR